MNTIKRNALLAFGLVATLNLGSAYAQSEHDGHHPQNGQAGQAGQAAQPRPGQDGTMQGMDHDRMMRMHDEHMGQGHMMDHGDMGHDGMDHDSMGNGMHEDRPRDAGQGTPHDH